MQSPPDDPTTVARNAGLQNLAKYLVAIDSKNMTGEAHQTFEACQHVASLILLDALREYKFTEPVLTGEPTKPPPKPKKA